MDTRHEIVLSNPDVDVRFYYSIDKGSFVTPHWHDSLEIVYVIRGSVTLILPFGKRQTATDGEFFLVNPRVIHSVLSEDNEALVLQIPQRLYTKLAPSVSSRHFVMDMHPDSPVEQTRLERMKKIFMDMYIVYHFHPEGYLLKFNSLLYDALYMLIHSYSEKIMPKEINRSDKYLQRMTKIIKYIDENHSNSITTSDIAKQMGYNADYIARFFHRYMNMSITDYIYEVRMGYVSRELQNSDKKIGDILEEHGCNNYRILSQKFKERYGCSFKEYRIQKRTEQSNLTEERKIYDATK